ncbi:phosphotransferase [Glycomyces terrestris]|uniref:phosphotransferase n=1 Tax=Glycomyces terrestris TaxID=2493553 RepID=UPI0018D4E453|nr:phosphotransferase [Glycomyces terrestris]
MTESPEAVPLAGGRVAAGVARVGDVVHRPAGAGSDFMAALLLLLEERGFTGAPRYLGRSAGADLLSYLPGDVPARFQTWSDAQVAAAAALLRAMHDATRGSALAGRFDVVCHHDPGPNNAVFRDGVPVAFIDFAEAAPGGRLEDVAYLAWTWAVASQRTVPVRRQAEQVRLVADAYGLEPAERAVLVDCILERQSRNVRFWTEFPARAGAAAATAAEIGERIAWSRREHAFTHAHREVFDAALA